MKTRSDAWALLTEFTQSQSLRRHALADPIFPQGRYKAFAP